VSFVMFEDRRIGQSMLTIAIDTFGVTMCTKRRRSVKGVFEETSLVSIS
jgi:hypothetical protein